MTDASATARVAVTRDGPYIVTGDVPLVRLATAPEPACRWAIEATLPPRLSYALCRCGRSKMAPFCDYKHLRGRFDGTETAAPTGASAGGEAAAPSIGFAAVGPLWLRGAIDVVSANGSIYAAAGALCRCGASATKPFCDGSHEGQR